MKTCKICGSSTVKLFSKKILKKYDADYFKCSNCEFIQTSEPVWLNEAYNSAITKLDIGLLSRNQILRDSIIPILDACFPEANTMLDYAGGYGVLVRLMRDAGFNFYRQDIYCENIFAEHFDINDVKLEKFDVLTAFEVAEHFTDPLNEIKKLFEFSDHVIFSTELQEQAGDNVSEWWYIAPETGQHVAFYSRNTMYHLSRIYGKNYYGRDNIHVFTSKQFDQEQIDYAFNNVRNYSKWFGLKKSKLDYSKKRESLLWTDFNYIKSLLQ